MEHISKNQIKLVRSLQQKKNRDLTGWFVAEGSKCIGELRKSHECVMTIDTTNATPQEIEQMSSLRTPQGAIAVFKQKTDSPLPTADSLREPSLVLVLDGIQDPGNLGTIIRTCDWFGITDIVCSRDTADCYNPKVVQATMGALARVRIHYTDLQEWLESISREPSIPIYGTLLDGGNMYEVSDRRKRLTEDGTKTAAPTEDGTKIIIMGNEGNGISRSVREYITVPIRIPSYPEGAETSESLNVAVATAIVVAEMRRPR
ncbi:MAG: RNA methyltransferase [Paludibacteraceae bacterium]|nr:RNA methyltransferase [Paludibacteraceae bacterium]